MVIGKKSFFNEIPRRKGVSQKEEHTEKIEDPVIEISKNIIISNDNQQIEEELFIDEKNPI